MQTPEDTAASLQLDDMLRAVRRRWPTALVVMLLGLMVGIGLASAAPKNYTASTSVVIDTAAGATASTSASEMATEAQTVTSTSVVERAAELSGFDASTLRDGLTVSNPDSSRVLRITYAADTADAAAAGANAVGQAYLDQRGERAKAQAEASAAPIKERAEALRNQLSQMTANQSALASAYGQQLATLEARLADLDLTGDASDGRIVSQASPPTAAAGPSLAIYAVGGLFLGVVAAVGAALLRDRLSRRARDARLLSQRLDAPVVTAGRRTDAEDAIRTLALRLDLHERPDPLVVAVVSPGPTGVAAGLSKLLRNREGRTRLLNAAGVSARRIDRGWPRDRGQANVTVVELSERIDNPLAVAVASRADVVVLALPAGARLGAVNRFLSLLHATGHGLDGALLLHRRSPLVLTEAPAKEAAKEAAKEPAVEADTAPTAPSRATGRIAAAARATLNLNGA
ncbi:Wzz/FepE/Etk N-terminal domain-containing protein [Nocardioides sp.]|uniref:Wzz/FepE/Etk N-terminal domain-containing protein n=1 Tax=Nocardioides sp. TaxID=35761 RepID=UPI0039E49F80